MTLDAFIQDLGHGLQEAAERARWTTRDLKSWIASSADEDLAALPFLGLRREVTHYRLVDRSGQWDDHDLVDMLFLPCAAAYADHVVCEKKTGTLMRRALGKRPGGAAIHLSIAEAGRGAPRLWLRFALKLVVRVPGRSAFYMLLTIVKGLEDRMTQRGQEPQDLVTGAEIGRRLGISRERVRQLA